MKQHMMSAKCRQKYSTTDTGQRFKKNINTTAKSYRLTSGHWVGWWWGTLKFEQVMEYNMCN